MARRSSLVLMKTWRDRINRFGDANQSSGKQPTLFPSFVQKIATSSENELEFDDDQRTRLDLATGSYRTAIDEQHDIRKEELRTKGVTSESVVRKYNEVGKREGENLNRKYQDILLPFQKAAIRRLLANEMLPKLGIVCNLLTGDLGRDINLDSDQKTRIREQCRNEIEKFEAQLLNWDQTLVDMIGKSMESPNRTKLDSALGKKLTYIVPTLHVFVSSTKK